MNQDSYDVIVRGGRIIDPANGRDAIGDVGISGDRIVAIESTLQPGPTTTQIEAMGRLVCPGLVDLHTHVCSHFTGFGIDADDVGVNAGVTTAVDMGSTGTWHFRVLKSYIIDQAVTDIAAFLMMGYVGASIRLGGENILNADWADPESLAEMAETFPDHIRGFKTWGESGTTSHWGYRFLEIGRQASELTGLPCYIHTGELWPVDESNRPDADTILPIVLDMAAPGDVLGHCYSAQPDGILGATGTPLPQLREALDAGVLLDVGHGINFSFETARRMLDNGYIPDIVSSDSHGLLSGIHEDRTLSYSLVGTMSKLLALGVGLSTVVSGATVNPAKVLRMDAEIGTLAIGSRADLTVLDIRTDDWTFIDPLGGTCDADRRLVPSTVIRAGQPLVPSKRFLRDVCTPDERGERDPEIAVGGRPR
jgi:dihydroorotase